MLPAVLLVAALGQAATASAPAPDPALARIRKALAEAPGPVETSGAPDAAGRPVFRVHIVRRPEKPVWDQPTLIPDYVFPPTTGLHYEFLNLVTPEYWRASTIYPVGVPVGSLLRWFWKATKEEAQRHREVRARGEVRQALADLEIARRSQLVCTRLYFARITR